MEDHTYSTPEKKEQFDFPPLPPIIKNKNFRKNSDNGENTISIVNAELASHKLLLHDALQALHHNANTRKKYNKKITTLTIVTILLTNLLSVTITGSLTYFVTTQARPELQSGPTNQSGPGIPSIHI